MDSNEQSMEKLKWEFFGASSEIPVTVNNCFLSASFRYLPIGFSFLNILVATCLVSTIEYGLASTVLRSPLISLKENETNVVILDGITFAGFNVVDVDLLFQETGIPIIVFTDKKPDTKAMKRALMKHFPDWELRWSLVKNRGQLNSIIVHGETPVYFEVVGCFEDWAERVLRVQCVNSKVPEAVRVAKMIARSISPFF